VRPAELAAMTAAAFRAAAGQGYGLPLDPEPFCLPPWLLPAAESAGAPRPAAHEAAGVAADGLQADAVTLFEREAVPRRSRTAGGRKRRLVWPAEEGPALGAAADPEPVRELAAGEVDAADPGEQLLAGLADCAAAEAARPAKRAAPEAPGRRVWSSRQLQHRRLVPAPDLLSAAAGGAGGGACRLTPPIPAAVLAGAWQLGYRQGPARRWGVVLSAPPAACPPAWTPRPAD
jgi:hypothetical protein